MKRILLSGLLFACCLWGVGCQSVSRQTTHHVPAAAPPITASAPAERQPEEKARPRFGLRQKLNPLWWLGNADEPTAPDDYRVGEKLRTLKWHLRNPFHNFTFYVIGIADKEFTRTGCFREQGWTWAVCRHGWLRLPFISYRRGGFTFYCGWRDRGNFGFKFNYSTPPPPPTGKPCPPALE